MDDSTSSILASCVWRFSFLTGLWILFLAQVVIVWDGIRVVWVGTGAGLCLPEFVATYRMDTS